LTIDLSYAVLQPVKNAQKTSQEKRRLFTGATALFTDARLPAAT
jgi:hypothetical protein